MQQHNFWERRKWASLSPPPFRRRREESRIEASGGQMEVAEAAAAVGATMKGESQFNLQQRVFPDFF